MFLEISRSALLASLVLIPLSVSVASPNGQNPTIVTPHAGAGTAIAGTWLVKGSPNNAPGFTNLSTITADGLIVNEDPGEGTSFGTVTHVRANRYEARFHGFFDPKALETFEVRGSMTLSRDRRSFAGPFVTTVRHANGAVKFRFAGTVAASRL